MYNYPNNAKTSVTEWVGASQGEILPVKNRTILAVKFMQSGTQSDTSLRCGGVTGNIVAKNYAKDTGEYTMNYFCSNNLYVVKTGGGDSALVTIIYTDYNMASVSEPTTDLYNLHQSGIMALAYVSGVMTFLITLSIIVFYFKKK